MPESHSQRSSNPPVAIESPECPRCRGSMIVSRIMPGRLNFDSRMLKVRSRRKSPSSDRNGGHKPTKDVAALLTAHREGGCRGNLTQTSEPHNGLSGKLLSELHAALVGGAFRLVQIDVRQLFGAA
jgi:hypothetical protein